MLCEIFGNGDKVRGYHRRLIESFAGLQERWTSVWHYGTAVRLPRELTARSARPAKVSRRPTSNTSRIISSGRSSSDRALRSRELRSRSVLLRWSSGWWEIRSYESIPRRTLRPLAKHRPIHENLFCPIHPLPILSTLKKLQGASRASPMEMNPPLDPLRSSRAFGKIHDILPFDILHTIILHVHASNPPGHAQERDTLSISQVSQMWRNYALVTPQLWSSIDFRGASLGHEPTWTERSQNVMLEVTIRSLAPALLPQVREILRPHGHRIRSLDMWYAPGDALNVFFHTPEPLSTPRLQQLAISSTYDRPVRCTLPYFPQLVHL